MSTLFIIDIDATIADATYRLKKAGKEPSREDKVVYNAWVGAVQNGKSLLADSTVPGMVDMLVALGHDNNRVVFLTSREEQWRTITVQWLREHGFPLYPLHMRPQGCYVDSTDMKEIAIKALSRVYRDSSVVVLDDDPLGTMEGMCKKNGFTFLKACSGS